MKGARVGLATQTVAMRLGGAATLYTHAPLINRGHLMNLCEPYSPPRMIDGWLRGASGPSFFHQVPYYISGPSESTAGIL